MNPEPSTTERHWDPDNQDKQSQFSRMYDQTERYVKTTIELYRLRAVKKGAGIFSSVATGVVLGLVFVMVLLFASIGLAFYLGDVLGGWHYGFFIVCGLYLIVGTLVYVFRNKFIRKRLSDYFVKEIFED